MTGAVTGRYTAEEIKSMTAEQVLSVIEQGIHEDKDQQLIKFNPALGQTLVGKGPMRISRTVCNE
jgi:hypothetical protein